MKKRMWVVPLGYAILSAAAAPPRPWSAMVSLCRSWST